MNKYNFIVVFGETRAEVREVMEKRLQELGTYRLIMDGTYVLNITSEGQVHVAEIRDEIIGKEQYFLLVFSWTDFVEAGWCLAREDSEYLLNLNKNEEVRGSE